MMVLMEDVVIVSILAILGLAMGSFAGATVWRLRARQLVEDKASGEPVDAKEYKALLPLSEAKTTSDRSRCLRCGHQLKWYDLIPLASWIRTRGNCRYCKEPIGRFELLIELGTAAVFVVSYLLWPEALDSASSLAQFGLWLVAVVMLAILFAYDLKWFLLPDVVVFPLIAVGGLVALLGMVQSVDPVPQLISLAVAVVILSGIYYALWLISKGQWIGFGDVKLGLALALLLGDWRLAFIALFAANLIGCLLVIPGMIVGKISRMTRVPFGPLLILGGIIAMLGGPAILGYYMQMLI